MLGWFSDNTNIFVMLEECLGGELWELIKTVGCPVPRARYYLAQLINAVTYLRDARIWVQWFRQKWVCLKIVIKKTELDCFSMFIYPCFLSFSEPIFIFNPPRDNDAPRVAMSGSPLPLTHQEGRCIPIG